MSAQTFRYRFNSEVPLVDIESSMVLALLGAESLHGETQVQLSASHYIDAAKRACVIDATDQVGQDINRLFLGFMAREFGRDSVIAPPSIHESGSRYEWESGMGTPSPIPPSWLNEIAKDAIQAAATVRANGRILLHLRAQKYVANADGASAGARNDAAFRLAGHIAAELPDVSQLNALQVHMANDCIYFWRPDIEEYLVKLILAHRSGFDAPRSVLKIHRPGQMLIDGAPSEGEILHTFDHQLPHRLELSFVQAASPPKRGVINWARNKKISDELRRMLDVKQAGTPIEAIVADVEANLRRRKRQ